MSNFMGDDKPTNKTESDNPGFPADKLVDDHVDNMDSYEADLSDDFQKTENNTTKSAGEAFDKSIDKLENLIAENGISSNSKPENTSEEASSTDVEIPILTDVIDADEIRRMSETVEKLADDISADNEIESAQIDRLSELVDTVDKKLSKELDSLVDLLKDTIKDSIIDELKEELKRGESKQSNEPSAPASKDKPTE